MINTDQRFIPANPVEAAIRAGDIDAMAAALRAFSPAQRTKLRGSLRALDKTLREVYWDKSRKLARWWGGQATNEQLACAAAALFVCGTARDHADVFLWTDKLFGCLDLLEAGALRRLAGVLVRSAPHQFHRAQRLIVEGWSDRPDSEEYIIGLIGAPDFAPLGMSLPELVQADPALLAGPVLRVFQIQGAGLKNLASVDSQARESGNTWSAAFMEWIRLGHFTRAQLLGCTLGTLEQDWPQARAGWFSRFHDTLAPTPDEMAPFATRYLGLCQSRIAPTVTMAMGALAVLFNSGHVDAGQVLGALAPVMSARVKSQIDRALKLADQVVRQHPASAHAASALVQLALAHEAPEVHKKVIARLASWGFDLDTRSELEAVLPLVSASNRDALAALVGVGAPAPDAAPSVAPALRARPSLLDPARALAPLDDIDELVQVMASIFENEGHPDQFERALDGLARQWPLSEQARERLQPVFARALEVLASGPWHARWYLQPLATALARFAAVAAGPATLAPGKIKQSASAELSRRIDDLIVFAARHSGLSSLCTPTHRGGFISPDALVARLAAHMEAGVPSSQDEQVRALLRLASGDWPDARAAARALPQEPFVLALRYALGDDVVIGSERPLFVAAARIRHPGQDDAALLAAYGITGPDGACAARYAWDVHPELEYGEPVLKLRVTVTPAHTDADLPYMAMRRRGEFSDRLESELLYGATILPSCLDAFFASGVSRIGSNIDWRIAQWDDRAFLGVLLDAATPVTPVATSLLALALGGKEPGQSAMAVDALAAVVLEGRCDIALLAGDIRKILLSGLGKAARYAKSLASAVRADPAMPGAVCALLCGVLDTGDEAPPKDTGALLELLLELALGHGVTLAPHTAAVIGGLKLSGKGKAAQKALLAHLG